MDIEGTSILVILSVNGVIFLYLTIRLLFFYKQEKKTYHDLMQNNENLKKEEIQDYYLGDGTSHIESLLGKEENSSQVYATSNSNY